MKETSLHAGLKAWYAQSGGQVEQEVDGYLIDLRRESELVEIQTRHFSALRGKLEDLLERHVVRVVYPVAALRRILRIDSEGQLVSARQSPRKGQVYEVFNELTSLHAALAHPNFRLEVVLVHEEQVWQDDGQGSWRRRYWSQTDRRLVAVLGQVAFERPEDYASLLPPGLPESFTARDVLQGLELKGRAAVQQRLVGRMMKALRTLGVIEQIGKRGNAYLYCQHR
ncbi:MAG: hypothetical protein MUC85_00925 [Anaerolineales bacterium]|nr:hypothetical protein [Anaerolineales bacterium]